MKNIFKIILISILVLFIAAFIGLGIEFSYQIRYLPKIENYIGIDTSSPYIDGTEVIALSVNKNSIAEKSGLKNGDILKHYSLGKFAKDIYDSRGKPFSFEVKRDSQILTITILIPEALN